MQNCDLALCHAEAQASICSGMCVAYTLLQLACISLPARQGSCMHSVYLYFKLVSTDLVTRCVNLEDKQDGSPCVLQHVASLPKGHPWH